MADRDAQYTFPGLLEIDESFFAPSFSGKTARGTEKELLIVAVSVWIDEGGKERSRFPHAFLADNANANTIESILKRLGISAEEIEPLINAIRSDGWRSYEAVTKKSGLIHYSAILRDPKDSMNLLPWAHKIIANAKALFAGPYPGVSKKHLQGYLSEVCYRLNPSFWGREVFHRLLFACASTNTIMKDQLMSKKIGQLSQ